MPRFSRGLGMEHVRVTGFDDRAGFTNYHVEVTLADGDVLVAKRRFSEFIALHGTLRPGLVFPDKFRLYHPESVKHSRMCNLDKYLRDAVECDAGALQAFLGEGVLEEGVSAVAAAVAAAAAAAAKEAEEVASAAKVAKTALDAALAMAAQEAAAAKAAQESAAAAAEELAATVKAAEAAASAAETSAVTASERDMEATTFSRPDFLAMLEGAEKMVSKTAFTTHVNRALASSRFAIDDDLGRGRTLLHHVCLQPTIPANLQLAWAVFLLGLDASVDAVDLRGDTPLTCASVGGSGPLVATLLAHGADLEAANFAGERALHVAAMFGHDEAIRTLAAHGASTGSCVTSGEHAGRTAIVIARACLHTQTAKLLETLDPEMAARLAVQQQRRSVAEEAQRTAVEKALREASEAEEARRDAKHARMATARLALEEAEEVRQREIERFEAALRTEAEAEAAAAVAAAAACVGYVLDLSAPNDECARCGRPKRMHSHPNHIEQPNVGAHAFNSPPPSRSSVAEQAKSWQATPPAGSPGSRVEGRGSRVSPPAGSPGSRVQGPGSRVQQGRGSPSAEPKEEEEEELGCVDPTRELRAWEQLGFVDPTRELQEYMHAVRKARLSSDNDPLAGAQDWLAVLLAEEVAEAAARPC